MPRDLTTQEPWPPDSDEEASSRVVVLGKAALRIAYQHCGDRYGHRIVVADPGGLVTLLQSVESVDDVTWPESPPLQEFEVEPRGDHEVALLVGMAGASHWSASVEVNSDHLYFDVACRTRDVAAHLGSTYLAGEVRWTLQGDGAVVIQSHNGNVAVELRPHDGFSTRVKLLDDRRLWIGPDVEISKTPATVRWQYSLRRCDG